MNKRFLNKLTVTMIVSAGILAFDAAPVVAQSKTGQTNSSSAHTQHTGEKSKAASGMNSDKAMGTKSADGFVEKASEANLAEIELSKMALEKAASAKVKEFAQIMIDHHTNAQMELYSVVSSASSNQGNSMNDANDERDIESTNNDADKLATLGGTGGTTGNSMAQGKTNGVFNSNRGSADTDTITQGTTGPGTDKANTTNAATSPDSRMPGSTSDTSSMRSGNGYMKNNFLPIALSAEHTALKNKLSILSGEEFDNVYMQAMVKDHAEAVELFEKQALQAVNPALQSYASKMLPVIKEHYQLAQQLTK